MLDTVSDVSADGGSGGNGGEERAGDSTPGRKHRNRGADEPTASGDGAGSVGGDGDTVRTRKRGRPRKVNELAGEVPNPTLTEPTRRGRKKGPDLSTLVDTTVVGLFGLVAVATAHEHWLKDREEVMAITGPLNAWIDQLPAKTLKKVEQNLAPALFVVGLATVIGPDAVLEMRIRASQKRSSYPVSGSRGPGEEGTYQPADGTPRQAGGANGNRGGGEGWTSGIPAVPHIGSDYDV